MIVKIDINDNDFAESICDCLKKNVRKYGVYYRRLF